MSAQLQSGEGSIRVGLTVRDGAVQRVDLASSRTVSACRVFVGRRPDDVVAMADGLYTVCGRAQSIAALEALEAACGVEPPDPARRIGRGLSVLGEMLREHSERLLIDWPARLGQPDHAKAARGLRITVDALLALVPADTVRWHAGPVRGALAAGCAEAIVNALEKELAAALLGDMSQPLTGIEDELGFERWLRGGGGLAWLPGALRGAGLADTGASDCPPMPELDVVELHRRLGEDGERFAARPDWSGTVFETGPLARQWRHPVVAAARGRVGAGVLARVTARLLELAGIPRQMRALLAGAEVRGANAMRYAPADGSGLAVLETACGRLAHRVSVDGERVACYRTLAPPEWNFHPMGPLVTGLVGRPAADAAQASCRARLAAAALDPCVDLEIDAVAA